MYGRSYLYDETDGEGAVGLFTEADRNEGIKRRGISTSWPHSLALKYLQGKLLHYCFVLQRFEVECYLVFRGHADGTEYTNHGD